MNDKPSESDIIDPELVRLVDKLGSPFFWVQRQAREALQAHSESALEPLLALFEQERARARRRIRFMDSIKIAGLSLSILCSLLCIALLSKMAGDPTNWLFGGAFLLLVLTGCLLPFGKIARRHKQTARALALFDDIRVIGPLAEALEFEVEGALAFRPLRPVILKALRELLPKLRPEDNFWLSGPQTECLCHAIAAEDDLFVISIVKAIEVSGDTCALPVLRRLVKVAWPGAKAGVHAAAQDCLAALEARAAKERESQTLLRGASVPSASSDTLLRPAAAGNSVEPQELLRASIGRDAEEA